MCDGLSHMHKHGFFHRDIKPENLLLDGECIKLGQCMCSFHRLIDLPVCDSQCDANSFGLQRMSVLLVRHARFHRTPITSERGGTGNRNTPAQLIMCHL